MAHLKKDKSRHLRCLKVRSITLHLNALNVCLVR